MASSTYGPPLSSHQSTSSDLSEPPDFTEEELAQFTAAMAPPRAESEGRDEIVAEVAEVAPATRSSRRRVPSKRAQVTFTQPPTSSATAAPKRSKMTNSKKWAPEYVTQSKQSPLVNKDLRALLLHPQAWDVLGDEDKKELIALFPDSRHILNANTPDARPNVMSLQNDDNFRHDTEEYVSDLKAGMHDPAWLQDAWAAHEARAAGQFDEYYVRKLEVDWKATIPDDLKPRHLRPADRLGAEGMEGAEGTEGAGDSRTEGTVDARVEGAGNPRTEGSHVSIVANSSEVAESNTEAKGGNDGVQDVVMASSTDGSAESVTEDLQKVSVANVHGDGNPDKMGTGTGVD